MILSLERGPDYAFNRDTAWLSRGLRKSQTDCCLMKCKPRVPCKCAHRKCTVNVARKQKKPRNQVSDKRRKWDAKVGLAIPKPHSSQPPLQPRFSWGPLSVFLSAITTFQVDKQFKMIVWKEFRLLISNSKSFQSLPFLSILLGMQGILFLLHGEGIRGTGIGAWGLYGSL